MTNQLCFAFDLDGVLVETIRTLYSAYLEILEGLGAEGSAAEFDFLNGKNVHEIAEHLKKAHQLACDEAELITLFQRRFDSLYSEVDLIAGAHWILEFLEAKAARLALASSSSRKNIDVILGRFNLKPFFELIVSGDDVKKAKPSPDIYNLVQRHFKSNRCYVVEDSLNGVEAARCAGLFTVLFDPEQKDRNVDASFVINDLHDIAAIVDECQNLPIRIANCTHVEIKSVQQAHPPTDEFKTRVEEIWQSELTRESTRFNDPILSYASHRMTPDGDLLIESFVSEYKYFLAQMRDSDLCCVHPLAVSGVVVDRNHHVLVGKRRDEVTEYPGLFEFVPSGGITPENGLVKGYQQQLASEFEEETGIPASSIEQIFPLALIYDPRHGVYDIALLVKLGIEILVEELSSNEYSSFSLVNADSMEYLVGNNELVPTSHMIYSALTHHLEQIRAS